MLTRRTSLFRRFESCPIRHPASRYCASQDALRSFSEGGQPSWRIAQWQSGRPTPGPRRFDSVCADHSWRGGRAAYGAGPENKRTARFRGFESPPLHQFCGRGETVDTARSERAALSSAGSTPAGRTSLRRRLRLAGQIGCCVAQWQSGALIRLTSLVRFQPQRPCRRRSSDGRAAPS